MSELDHITRRVEDAVKLYTSVKQCTDGKAWREGLLKEKVSAPVS